MSACYADFKAYAGEEEPQTAPAPAEPEEKLEFEEGCLMGFDFGDASHDLSYTDIKAAFPQFGFVEFQKVTPWSCLCSFSLLIERHLATGFVGRF